MDTLINGLETVLENELALHKQLLEAAVAMNTAIKTEDLPMVKEMGRKHDDLTWKIEELEEKRLEIHDALADFLGVPPKSNLSRIIKKLPENRAAKLAAIRAELKSVLGTLKMTTFSNQILLGESLRTIAKVFEFIDIAKAKLSAYKHHGKRGSALVTRTMINTVA